MIGQITSVWTELATFFVTIFQSILDLFWTPGVDGGMGSLTFVGVISVIAVGLGIVLLIVRIIKSFIALRS